jgi:hypothetical protein
LKIPTIACDFTRETTIAAGVSENRKDRQFGAPALPAQADVDIVDLPGRRRVMSQACSPMMIRF